MVAVVDDNIPTKVAKCIFMLMDYSLTTLSNNISFLSLKFIIKNMFDLLNCK